MPIRLFILITSSVVDPDPELFGLDFSLFLWVIFALLDPDPDPSTQINADPCGSKSGYGSGSETLARGMDPDPDPSITKQN